MLKIARIKQVESKKISEINQLFAEYWKGNGRLYCQSCKGIGGKVAGYFYNVNAMDDTGGY